MSAESLTEEQRAQRLRQRLWGATILIAIAVIVLPLLLDGSGSESQFRRVESLRQEPTRVINADGTRRTVVIPEPDVSESSDSSSAGEPEGIFQRLKRRFTENPQSSADSRRLSPPTEIENQAGQGQNPSFDDSGPVEPLPAGPAAGDLTDTTIVDYQAWVVQAGSFAEEANALAVRDRLRRDGYPSFVSMSNDASVFRVRVGPMVNKQQAGTVQQRVMELLGREAIVMPYP